MTDLPASPSPIPPEKMQGRRVDWTGDILKPGEYSKGPDGHWHGTTPNGHGCNLGNHAIVEHEDGTITASPSILVSIPGPEFSETASGPRRSFPGTEAWHGYLERGVWREA